jgi:hypothetical protein
VHFSTAFSCLWDKWTYPPGLPADFWELPDDRRLWPEACRVLASINHLGHLRITIETMCRLEQHRHPLDASPNQRSIPLMLEILLPLRAVSARDFVVEIPQGIDSLREELGEVPFRLVEEL